MNANFVSEKWSPSFQKKRQFFNAIPSKNLNNFSPLKQPNCLYFLASKIFIDASHVASIIL